MAETIDRTQGDERARPGRSMRDQANGPTQSVQEVAETFYSAIEKSLKNQPMTTLGFAVVTGFVLGALWKT
jgi:ElaB/YqjD/DUF883 family membrane-anchored ribosome-binding protein